MRTAVGRFSVVGSADVTKSDRPMPQAGQAPAGAGSGVLWRGTGFGGHHGVGVFGLGPDGDRAVGLGRSGGSASRAEILAHRSACRPHSCRLLGHNRLFDSRSGGTRRSASGWVTRDFISVGAALGDGVVDRRGGAPIAKSAPPYGTPADCTGRLRRIVRLPGSSASESSGRPFPLAHLAHYLDLAFGEFANSRRRNSSSDRAPNDANSARSISPSVGFSDPSRPPAQRFCCVSSSQRPDLAAYWDHSARFGSRRRES